MTHILDYLEARSPQGAERVKLVGWVELFAKPIMRPQIAA